MKKGTLFLLPNLLGEGSGQDFFSPHIRETMDSLEGLIAESEKGGWRFLRHFFSHEKIAEFPIRYLNEHSPKNIVEELLLPMKNGEKWGLISDAGLPAIADPGSSLVFAARKSGIAVHAYAGPSSVFLALLLSGFPAQSFSFHGYLPIDSKVLQETLSLFEKDRQTHLWIETPYRVEKRLQEMLLYLKEESYLGLVLDLTMPTEEVIVEKVKEWRKRDLSSFRKRLPIFLLGDPESKKGFGH